MIRKFSMLALLATLLLTACSVRVETDVTGAAEEEPYDQDVLDSNSENDVSVDAGAPADAPETDSSASEQVPSIDDNTEPTTESNAVASSTSQPESDEFDSRINRRVAADQTYPKLAQLLPFDGIRPVYDPLFAPAEEAPYLDDELVMGVAIDGQAKAYPVSVLRYREMVNDELAGIPILVTW